MGKCVAMQPHGGQSTIARRRALVMDTCVCAVCLELPVGAQLLGATIPLLNPPLPPAMQPTLQPHLSAPTTRACCPYRGLPLLVAPRPLPRDPSSGSLDDATVACADQVRGDVME